MGHGNEWVRIIQEWEQAEQGEELGTKTDIKDSLSKSTTKLTTSTSATVSGFAVPDIAVLVTASSTHPEQGNHCRTSREMSGAVMDVRGQKCKQWKMFISCTDGVAGRREGCLYVRQKLLLPPAATCDLSSRDPLLQHVLSSTQHLVGLTSHVLPAALCTLKLNLEGTLAKPLL